MWGGRCASGQRLLLRRSASLRLFSAAPWDKRNPALYSVYLVTDDKYLDDHLGDKVLAALRAGVTCVQLRLKKQSTGVYVEQAQGLLARMRADGFTHVPLIIDDRLDVALAADADGLHVGDGDLDPSIARRLLGPSKILGVSTYGQPARVEQAKAAGADYVAGGGVFASTTKAYASKGVAHLHEFRKVAAPLPTVAIGGLGLENAFDTVFAGADGIAAVSAFLEGSSEGETWARAAALKAEILRGLQARRTDKGSPDCNGETVAAAVARVRSTGPLVHCLANYVSMDITANVLLAASASPAMIHAKEEAADFAAIAGAVSINVGTLSPPWVEAFLDVAAACHAAKRPWVLDPVGAGATAYRTGVIKELLALRPSVLRGNPSEIAVCAGLLGVESSGLVSGTKGVDSTLDSSGLDTQMVDRLALATGGVVCATGRHDYVTDGVDSRFWIKHDVPQLQAITATGCSLSSLIGAFVAAEGASSSAEVARATTHACAYFSLAADRAALRLGVSLGPGSLRTALLDELAWIEPSTLAALSRIEKV